MRKTFTGLRAWLVQRISAVYMLSLIVFILAHFVVDPPRSYAAWHGWMTSSGVSIATGFFFAALLAHAGVAFRDLLMDYFHPVAVRIWAFASLGVGLTAMGVWVMWILWMRHG